VKLDKFNLKVIIKEIIIFILMVFIISLVINYLRKPEIDSNSLSYLQGKTIEGKNLNEFKKELPLVLHFWGTWCPICKQEAPNIQTISENYNVLTVAVDSGNDKRLKDWLKSRNLSFSVYNDTTGSLAKKFKIKVFPTTIIFDRSGKIKFIESGYTSTLGLISRIKLAQ
jgi:thiol-disulfide isomerase/thioredoxin